MAERLQKFLAKSGIGSRRYCEDLIKSNQITLNGKIAEIGCVVHQDDIIEYEGKIIAHRDYGIMNGRHSLTMDLSNFSKGLYIIETIVGQEVIIEKLVKE